MRSFVAGSTDSEIALSNDRDDMVMTTMSTFVSLTAHCARCHNHKFDPIRQEDYYRLQADFAGVDRADRAYDADPQVALAPRSRCAAQRFDETQGRYLASQEGVGGASAATTDLRRRD